MVVTDACRFLKHATALWVRRGGEDAVRVQAWSVVVDRFLSHAVGCSSLPAACAAEEVYYK